MIAAKRTGNPLVDMLDDLYEKYEALEKRLKTLEEKQSQARPQRRLCDRLYCLHTQEHYEH